MKVKRVIISGKKPSVCTFCRFEYIWKCVLKNKRLYVEDLGKIPSWCPLEVETDGWTEVDDGLPKNPGWVIAEDNRGEVYPCTYEDGRWLNDVQDELPSGVKIIHWRPLPEAPKEVKGE